MGFGTYEKVYKDQGNKCSVKSRQMSYRWETPVDFISDTRLSNYIANDNIRGYFRTQNWQNEIPELVGQGNIVQYIIDNNPVALVDSNRSLVILKDRTLPRSVENILFTIVIHQELTNL